MNVYKEEKNRVAPKLQVKPQTHPTPQEMNMSHQDEKTLREVLALLPPSETAALYRAQQVAAAREDNHPDSHVEPMLSAHDFFVFEEGHVWATAYRWSAYWKERASLFGAQDARAWGGARVLDLRDLSLSNPQEMAVIASGMIVPDANKNSVLYVDLSRKPAETTNHVLAKVLFFWMHAVLVQGKGVVAERNEARKNVSFVMSQEDFDSLESSVLEHLYGVMCRILPLQLRAVHLIQQNQKRTNANAYSSSFATTMSNLKSDLPQGLVSCIIKHMDRNVMYQKYSVPPPMDASSFATWLQSKEAPALGLQSTLSTEHHFTSLSHLAKAPLSETVALPGRIYSSTYLLSSSTTTLSTLEEVPNQSPAVVPSKAVATTLASPPTIPAFDTVQENENGDSFVETPTSYNQGEVQIKEAIDLMPNHEKAAYLQACQVVPRLVKLETPAIWFLQYDHYDVWAAAKRLVQYWTRRVEIFGDRAFLPMSQTGYGTLSPEDVHTTLRSGYLAILPESQPGGHSTLCYDASRLDGDDAQFRQRRLRCLFYMLSVLMEEDKHRSDGIEMLGIMNALTAIRSLGCNAPRSLVELFPVSVRWLHAARSKTRLPLLKTILPSLMQYLGKGAAKATFHLGDEEQVMQSLKAAGFSEAVLPREIGGSWTYDNFTEWCEERCQFEIERYPSMCKPPNSFAIPEKEQDKTAVPSEKAVAQNALAAFVDLKKKDQKANRRRQLRVMYSRQKRKRQKNMLNGLHEQVFDLRNEKVSLEKEKQRLERLLTYAQELTQPFDFNMRASGMPAS